MCVKRSKKRVVNPLRIKAWNMGVRDLRCDPKSSMGVRDLRCDPKSYVAQNKTHSYHIDFELCDRSRD